MSEKSRREMCFMYGGWGRKKGGEEREERGGGSMDSKRGRLVDVVGILYFLLLARFISSFVGEEAETGFGSYDKSFISKL